MSFPVESFWRLVVEAQLLTLEECHVHHAAWVQSGPKGDDAQALAEYLVASNVISKYQASILLAGRPGPFVYGDYRIYERIESGRLAGIFRALHVPTMHRVCLQFLTGEQAATPETVGYLAQRAAVVSRTSASFPHLLRCYHLVDLGAFKFFVLEDLLGKRIERILQQGGAMKPGEACRVTRQAALGLARLHGMQIAHGDVRPQNIWVDSSGTVKMLQFPLSRDPLAPPIDWRKLLAAPPEKLPVEADYIAPELLVGGQPDPRSDIYQLGCSLYQMLTNKPPFPGDDLRAKLEAHMKAVPAPIEKLNPKVPAELAKLVSYMMQKKPDMRYQQMASIIEKLLPFMSQAEAQSQPAAPTRASAAYDAWLMQVLAQTGGMPAQQPGGSGIGLPQTGHMMQPGPMQAGHMQGGPMMQPGQPMMQGNPMAPQGPMMGGPQAAPFGQPAAAPYGQPGPQFGGAPQRPGPMQGGPMQGGPQQGGPNLGAVGGGSSSMAERIRRRKQAQTRNMLIMLVIVAVVGGVGFVFRQKIMDLVSPKETAVAPAKPTATATAPAATAPKPTATAPVVVASQYPKRDQIGAIGTDPMFDSPTAGKPLNLAHLPRGVQLIAALRLADIAKHPEAEHLLDEKVSGALGPWLKTGLAAVTGVPNDKVEQLLVGVLDGPSADAVKLAYVVRMKEAVPEADLVAAWGSPAKETSGDAEFYANGAEAYYLPKSEAGKVLVIVPKDMLPDLLKLQGQQPPLTLELDYLALQTTDADRHLTLMYLPQFLESGGRSLVTGMGQKLMPAVNWLYTGVGLAPLAQAEGAGEAAPAPSAADAAPPKAVLASLHLGDSLFYELRLHNSGATAYVETLAEPLQARVKEIPQRVEDYAFSFPLSPYSAKFMRKFPDMLAFADKYVRVGAAERQFVLRGYMPAVAAHNIILGAHLCLIESGAGGAMIASTAGATGAAAPPKELTTLEKLRTTKMALAFDRNDLNKILALVQDELGIPIEMFDKDFQISGITKNQSMGLMEAEQTIDKLLQVILKKADKDGRLVYYVGPKEEGSKEEIVWIGTRAGLAERKIPLLPEFEQAADPKKK